MTCISLTLATLASMFAPADQPIQIGPKSCIRPTVDSTEFTDGHIDAWRDHQRPALDNELLLMNGYERYLNDPQMTLKPMRHA